MTKPMLLLAALTLCCCVASLHGYSSLGCQCLWTAPRPIPYRVIKTIEITPISGGCRRTEAVITRKNGSKVCVDPSERWFITLVSRVQNSQKLALSSTTVPPTTSFPPTSDSAEPAVKLNSTVN